MKVLFFQPAFLHYRIKFYEALAERLQTKIVIAHSGNAILKADSSKVLEEVLLKPLRFRGCVYQRGMMNLIKGYDVVVLPFDPHYSSFYLPLLSSGARFFYFGIGLGRSELANRMRLRILKKYKALLYSPANFTELSRSLPAEVFLNVGFFNNTIDVKRSSIYSPFDQRKSFIFVGSLDSRKGLEYIFAAFLLFTNIFADYSLIIVGDGPEREKLERLALTLKLNENIIFKGAVTDRANLASLYNQSIASLHYSQAGLAVLQSLGHGVPCILNRDAISGGEKYTVIDGFNGIVIEPTINDMASAMLKLTRCSKDWNRVSQNSQDYYDEHCSIGSMADQFASLIIEGEV